MTDSIPLSVIMAVYNAAESDLKASIESILHQSFGQFELILIDDGSTNGCAHIINEYAADDKRVRVIRHANQGLTRSLNIGIAAARGALIARQDADDISYPQRFTKQVALFGRDDVVLAGGNCDDLYEDGSRGLWGSYNEDELQRIVFFKSPFAHSTAMMRASVLRDLGGYDESFRTAQDMDLWMRFAAKGKIAMVAEPVLLRKIGAGAISSRRRWRQFYDGLRARWRHNRGISRVKAVYYAVRGLMIGLLPPGWIRALKKMLGRSPGR